MSACRLTRDDTHIFAEPVDRTLYPEYYRAIKRPMDFGTIMARLRVRHLIVCHPLANGLLRMSSVRVQSNGYPSAAHLYRDIVRRISSLFAKAVAYVALMRVCRI